MNSQNTFPILLSIFHLIGITIGESSDVRTFRFGMVMDADNQTPVEKLKKGKFVQNGAFAAYLREGFLTLTKTDDENVPFNVTLELDGERLNKIHNHEVVSKLGYGGRGMEFSTLAIFNNKLLTCDDKTGVVYELPPSEKQSIIPIPWLILADGNYTGPNGFKCEWSTIKDGNLIIGGHGNPSYNKSEFVKVVAPDGSVTHVSWVDKYDKIEKALGIEFPPGYVTNEAIQWSDTLGKWVILPRKISKVEFSESTDGEAGSNLYLIADEDFENLEVKEIGDVIPTHGFSAFAFVPTTDDTVILAIKSEEINGDDSWEERIASYIMAFDLAGNILYPETKFAAQKYEGLIFLEEVENSVENTNVADEGLISLGEAENSVENTNVADEGLISVGEAEKSVENTNVVDDV